MIATFSLSGSSLCCDVSHLNKEEWGYTFPIFQQEIQPINGKNEWEI